MGTNVAEEISGNPNSREKGSQNQPRKGRSQLSVGGGGEGRMEKHGSRDSMVAKATGTNNQEGRSFEEVDL